MKKIIIIFIIMLLITITIPVTGVLKEKSEYDTDLIENKKSISNNKYRSENSNLDDELDQYYTSSCFSRHLISSSPIAQTFKPTYPTITRIGARLFREGPELRYNHYVLRLISGIPSDNGNQIGSITVWSNEIGDGIFTQYFDIIDQVILPGATYHIEIKGINVGIGSDDLYWCYDYDEPYTNGAAYIYEDGEWKLLQSEERTYDFGFRTYGTDFGGNHPPNRPNTPSGPSIVKQGTTNTYSSSSTDPDAEYIKYGWDWDGDNTVDDWSDFEFSGDTSLIDYTWNNMGTYQVRVKAMDEHNRESGWSDPLSVTVLKSKSTIPLGIIIVFGFDVDVKILQLEPGEDYVDLEVLSKPFYIWENGLQTRNPGEFIRLYNAKGLFSPSLPFCFGICADWGIIG